MNFLFAGDPMCSWCYGFAKELDAARQQLPGLKLEIRVAGVWAGGRDVLDEAARQFRLGHWARVEAASGVSFNRAAFVAREGFVYDTEPISRAFVAGKHLFPGVDQLRLFRALQHAFYVDGLDTTSDAILRQVLQRALHDQGCEAAEDVIGRAQDSIDVAMRTQAEFDQVRAWELRSFPQLLHLDGERVSVLCNGFDQAAGIVQRVRRIPAAAHAD